VVDTVRPFIVQPSVQSVEEVLKVKV